MIALICLAACGSGQGVSQDAHRSTAPAKVVVATGFSPDVEFAPYYVAQAMGYYRQAGVSVSMNYDKDPNLMQDVGNGKYTFAVTGGDSAVVAASAGAPIEYVMAQYQKYPIGAMTLKVAGPNLTSPRQLAGQTVGISAPGSETDFGLRALLANGGLTQSSVKTVAIGFTETEALVSHQVQVAMTYIDNEPVQAAALGYQTNVLPVANYLKLTSNGVVTSRTMMSHHRTEVRGFVKATLQGLAYTLAHPDAAFKICLKDIPTLVDAKQIAVERKVLAARLTFQQPPSGHPLGWSNPEGWRTTIQFLKSIDAIKSAPRVSDTFTNSVVDAVAVHAT